jgi:hypothetical protein
MMGVKSMNEQKLRQHITAWLIKNHAPESHQSILNKVLAVGKPSKPWVESIQRYVREVSFQTPDRGEVKRACRALLEERG